MDGDPGINEKLLDLNWLEFKNVLSAEKNQDIMLATLNARLQKEAPPAEVGTVPIDILLAASKIKDKEIDIDHLYSLYGTVAKKLGELEGFSGPVEAMRFTLLYSFATAVATLFNERQKVDNRVST